MAVYPDRIVLKNSTSARATIEAAIGAGGADAIAAGEVVLGLENNSARLYTRADDGSIVSIGATTTNVVIVSSSTPTQNNDAQPLQDGDLWFNPSTGVLSTYYSSTWDAMIAGAPVGQTLADISDVEITNLADSQFLRYDSSSSKWINVDITALGTVTSVDVTASNGLTSDTLGPITDQGAINISMDDTGVIAGSYVAANLTVNSRGQITAVSNGSSGTNPLNSLDALNDVSTAGEVVGDLIQLGPTGQYTPRSVGEILSGSGSGNFVGVSFPEYELAGIDGFYNDDAAMTADGFTVLSNYYFQADIPALYLGVDYLGLGLTGMTVIHMNDRGGIGLSDSVSSSTIVSSTGGLAGARAKPLAPFYVSGMYGSAALRRKGYKEVAKFGTTWLVLRGDFSYPNSQPDSGYPIEFWLGQNGHVRVVTGAPVGTQPGAIPVYVDTAGVVSYGVDVVNGEDGIQAAGRYEVAYAAGAFTGGDLGDLQNVQGSPADAQVLAWNATQGAWMPQTVSGVAGSGANIGFYSVEAQTSTGGVCQFFNLGTSGTLQKILAADDCWVVLYANSQSRTADASRSYGVAAAEGSGVLAEFTLTAGTEQMASPGTSYFNADSTPATAIYAAVRTTAGVAVSTTLTISAYGMSGVDVIRGGTFGSGL